LKMFVDVYMVYDCPLICSVLVEDDRNVINVSSLVHYFFTF
jgi:hypothetical protein